MGGKPPFANRYKYKRIVAPPTKIVSAVENGSRFPNIYLKKHTRSRKGTHRNTAGFMSSALEKCPNSRNRPARVIPQAGHGKPKKIAEGQTE